MSRRVFILLAKSEALLRRFWQHEGLMLQTLDVNAKMADTEQPGTHAPQSMHSTRSMKGCGALEIRLIRAGVNAIIGRTLS